MVQPKPQRWTSAAAFTPGETVHQTPIKTIGAATAAADEDEELCAWLQQKASLTKRVVDKVLPKLHDEDVCDVSPRPSSLPKYGAASTAQQHQQQQQQQ